MNKKLGITATLACCFMICVAAIITDLSGKWSGNITAPDGKEVTLTYNIKVEGDKITGTAEASQGNIANIDDGKMTGNEFTFKITSIDGQDIPHKGTYYAQGDSIGMDIDFTGIKFHCKLKRDK
ncbi:hypothetical protein [Mucilaginibacter flavidus]|uniref:hypothetical protein n=1 Tax=Mucilaginibacter flavidus TaxID=2949309 RepID=UPI002093C170|nr:hypothetical protein [Mucilaginibacter flavidus]MCO5945901.1 hypothetical protein [Mucilaginibacter flavidus]